jgi:hypothetical protein
MEQKQSNNKPMDKRCPRQLAKSPTSYCPLAVQRLKALRHAGRELTEEEEALLPGCPFAINHQLANYCFFNFIDQFTPDDKPLSDMEIAHYCNLSTETIKKVEKKALQKMRESKEIQEIVSVSGGDAIMEDSDYDPEWNIPI